MRPISHSVIPGISSSIHLLMVGSRKAKLTLAMMRAPLQTAM